MSAMDTITISVYPIAFCEVCENIGRSKQCHAERWNGAMHREAESETKARSRLAGAPVFVHHPHFFPSPPSPSPPTLPLPPLPPRTHLCGELLQLRTEALRFVARFTAQHAQGSEEG